MTSEDILADYDDLELGDILATLLFAARLSEVKALRQNRTTHEALVAIGKFLLHQRPTVQGFIFGDRFLCRFPCLF